MKNSKILSSVFFLILFSACAQNSETKSSAHPLGEPVETAMAGTFNATGWNFQSGVVRQDLRDHNRYNFRLYETVPAGDICEYSAEPGARVLAFWTPKAIGTYTLGYSSMPTVSFMTVGSTVSDATNGKIVIQAENGHSVVGKLNALADDNTAVDGKFIVTFCP